MPLDANAVGQAQGGIPKWMLGLHNAIDPVKAMGGYGNLAAMALPVGRMPMMPSLVVARRMADGTIRYGKPGQTHADLLTKSDTLMSKRDAEIGNQMGFAIPGGQYMTRHEAASFVNSPAKVLEATAYQSMLKK